MLQERHSGSGGNSVDRCHLRLLQHDFADPDGIGIAGAAQGRSRAFRRYQANSRRRRGAAMRENEKNLVIWREP